MQIVPRIRVLPEENGWFVDLIGVSAPADVEKHNVGRGRRPSESLQQAFQGPLLLMWGSMIRLEPPIFRVHLYARPSSELKIVERSLGFDIVVTHSNQRKRNIRRSATKVTASSMIAPKASVKSLYIAVAKEERVAIAKYLAFCAGKEIQFAEGISGYTTFRGKFESYEEALRALALRENWAINDSGKKILVTNRGNGLIDNNSEGSS